LAGFRVVLIEDDRDVLAATAALLRGWGCEVQDFDSLPEAVEPTDLILTDFDLGNGMTGTWCISHIRWLTRTEIPAIVMTGHDEARVRSLIDLPRVQLMTKPLRPSALRSLLSSVRIGAF
jgi:CheY-like chemotaxis protein